MYILLILRIQWLQFVIQPKSCTLTDKRTLEYEVKQITEGNDPGKYYTKHKDQPNRRRRHKMAQDEFADYDNWELC